MLKKFHSSTIELKTITAYSRQRFSFCFYTIFNTFPFHPIMQHPCCFFHVCWWNVAFKWLPLHFLIKPKMQIVAGSFTEYKCSRAKRSACRWRPTEVLKLLETLRTSREPAHRYSPVEANGVCFGKPNEGMFETICWNLPWIQHRKGFALDVSAVMNRVILLLHKET